MFSRVCLFLFFFFNKKLLLLLTSLPFEHLPSQSPPEETRMVFPLSHLHFFSLFDFSAIGLSTGLLIWILGFVCFFFFLLSFYETMIANAWEFYSRNGLANWTWFFFSDLVVKKAKQDTEPGGLERGCSSAETQQKRVILIQTYAWLELFNFPEALGSALQH